ncbi:hypothetical protein HID58_089029, partial [Brassica napus]
VSLRLRDLILFEFGCDAKLRVDGNGNQYVTDNSYYPVEGWVRIGPSAKEIGMFQGVVKHGLFLGMATSVIIAGKNGVDVMSKLGVKS